MNRVLAQTFTDWELIAIDDHLTDNTQIELQQWELKNQRISRIALGRLCTPEDIADACSFLVSGRAS